MFGWKKHVRLRMMNADISPQARRLGYAGLTPQLIAFLLVLDGGESGYVGLSGAYGYAAIIFSFLGGMWWGLALQRQDAPRWIFIAAVMPSLIAFGTYLPWTIGAPWPEPSMLVIGACIMASPLVDLAIGGLSAAWIRLRWHLSLGLGGLTIATALI